MLSTDFIAKFNAWIGSIFLGVFGVVALSVYRFAVAYPLDSWGQLTLNKTAMLGISVALGGGALAWGVCSLAYRRRPGVANANLALLSAAVFSPILGEAVLRVGIGAEVPMLRNPELYADAYSEDDYWKLSTLWSDRSVRNQDPLLGWSSTLSTDAAEVLQNDRDAILFFGDSFVYGDDGTVPTRLGLLLPQHSIFNYGVYGYGIDQIYLRFKQEAQQFTRPIVLFGMLTLDLDRSILSFRERTKPRFVVENDLLRLTNTPIPLISAKAWVEDHPPEIRSYFFSVLLRFVDLLGADLDDKNVSNKLEEKRRVNRLLLNEAFHLANTEEMRLAFILFYSQAEITHEGWREKFFKETLRELNAPYLDTKALLLQNAEQRGIEISEFYDETDHHTALGNAVIAEGLAAFMQRKGWDEPRKSE
ncbi:MAG: hypothetical protein JRD03_08605 [Deltaproteobacteria bacterium]|nr:hypothetical protein [Deltaproteobacteria bacterium]